MTVMPGLTDGDRASGVWFQQKVRRWFELHHRTFCWRDTKDPYAVLLAELMLHRTQARQVEPVYRRALDRYPTVSDLAQADEAE